MQIVKIPLSIYTSITGVFLISLLTPIDQCGLAAEVARKVALGGRFEALLADRVRLRLNESGFSVYAHRVVPPNDGGIALGQVAVAASQIREQEACVSAFQAS